MTAWFTETPTRPVVSCKAITIGLQTHTKVIRICIVWTNTIVLLYYTRSELASFAHSLYTCIKHYIKDCAVEKFQLGHVAVWRGRLKHYHTCAHPDRTYVYIYNMYMWLAQLATQENHYLCCSFAHKSSQERTSKVELPPSVEHPCITSTPKSSSFAITGLPRVSLPFNLILFSSSYEVLSLACG